MEPLGATVSRGKRPQGSLQRHEEPSLYGKYNGHSPSDQVVPLVERFFDFTRGQPEPPACNRTGSARDWYLKRHEQGSGACGLQPPPSVHEAAEATRAVHRVFGINSTHAFGRDCRAAPPYLAAHVRSGDVFQGNWDKDGGWMPGKVHPDYGQPVLSYYVQCVAAARRDGVQRMIVVCEDFRNPVCLALRTMAPLVDGLSVRRLPLLETLQTLGCASRVCKAVGSFSSISQLPQSHRYSSKQDGRSLSRGVSGACHSDQRHKSGTTSIA